MFKLLTTFVMKFVGDKCKIMRGTWFYDQSWQPVEEGYAMQIETEYLSTFLGHKLEPITNPAKGPKPGLLHFNDCNVL